MKIYLDSAKRSDILEGVKIPEISGFTTNPSLAKTAGIIDYSTFCTETIQFLKKERPDTNISLEVFADDLVEMKRQALKIHRWSENYNYPVFVKIPVTNTLGESTSELVGNLNFQGVRVNVTAVFTENQTTNILENIKGKQELIISVFAGRIADTGRNAQFIMENHFNLINHDKFSNVKLLWASCRQIYSSWEAERVGCDIITMSLEQIKKRNSLYYKNLESYSLETVKMFYDDALKSGFIL